MVYSAEAHTTFDEKALNDLTKHPLIFVGRKERDFYPDITYLPVC